MEKLNKLKKKNYNNSLVILKAGFCNKEIETDILNKINKKTYFI